MLSLTCITYGIDRQLRLAADGSSNFWCKHIAAAHGGQKLLERWGVGLLENCFGGLLWPSSSSSSSSRGSYAISYFHVSMSGV